MSNAASLRIKFNPLLKRISSQNVNSNCCIEIVPELSSIHDLGKIDWKSEKDLVEYSIPMTYKIIIKKQEELQTKVYHSCVDLLPAYSMSSTDLGAGDVKRTRSDDEFVLSLNSGGEKCNLIPTKNLLTAKESCENVNTMDHRTTSLQTLKIIETHSSLASHKSVVDQCLGVDFSNYEPLTCEPIITMNHSQTRATKSEETLIADLFTCDNATTTFDLLTDTAINLAKKNSTGSLNAYIESFMNSNTHHKLTLSPICSVSTWDVLPPGPVFITNNTSRYIFCNNDAISKDYTRNIDYSQVERPIRNRETSKNMHYDDEILQKLDDIIQTNTYDRKYYAYRTFVNPESAPRQSNEVKDTTTSMSQITMTGETKCVDNFARGFNSQVNKSSSGFITENIYDTIDLSEYTKPEERRCYKTPSTMTNNENLNILKNNDFTLDNPSPFSKRVLPAVRVARLLKILEEEIYPLKQKLHEIKCRCVVLGLGLFCGEFIPSSQKSIIYKTVSNGEHQVEENSSKENQSAKSNRVVYTILFNG